VTYLQNLVTYLQNLVTYPPNVGGGRDKDAYLKGAIEALVQDVALLLPQVCHLPSLSKTFSHPVSAVVLV